MKKYLIFLLVAAFAVSMLFIGIGCKEEAPPVEEEAVEEEAREPVTLKVWTVGLTPEMLQASMYAADGEWNKRLQEKYNITLDVEFKGWDVIFEVLTTAGISQEGADILVYLSA